MMMRSALVASLAAAALGSAVTPSHAGGVTTACAVASPPMAAIVSLTAACGRITGVTALIEVTAINVTTRKITTLVTAIKVTRPLEGHGSVRGNTAVTPLCAAVSSVARVTAAGVCRVT